MMVRVAIKMEAQNEGKKKKAPMRKKKMREGTNWGGNERNG